MSAASDNVIMIEDLGRLEEDEVLGGDSDDDQLADLPAVGDGTGRILLDNLPMHFNSDRSVATTQLATEVGSVMGVSKTPFLKSFTVKRRQKVAETTTDNANEEEPETVAVDWGSLEFKDVKVKRKKRVMVQNLRGLIAQEYSGIKEGDYVHSIDLQPVSLKSSEWDAEKVKTTIDEPSELPYFCLATTFPTGNDVWVQATIIKPDPDMTLEEMGMTVWFWGFVSTQYLRKRSHDSALSYTQRSFLSFVLLFNVALHQSD
jgi:hypothetical protein